MGVGRWHIQDPGTSRSQTANLKDGRGIKWLPGGWRTTPSIQAAIVSLSPWLLCKNENNPVLLDLGIC
jgi:hypothetical protein